MRSHDSVSSREINRMSKKFPHDLTNILSGGQFASRLYHLHIAGRSSDTINNCILRRCDICKMAESGWKVYADSDCLQHFLSCHAHQR